MFRNGLLVLTSAVLNQSIKCLQPVIKSSVQAVRSLLYVHLVNHGNTLAKDLSGPLSVGIPCTRAVRQYITAFYTEAARTEQSVEVRFLIGNISGSNASTFPSQHLEHEYDVVLTDLEPSFHDGLTLYLKKQFPVSVPFVIKQIEKDTENTNDWVNNSSSTTEPVKTYRSVCVGGAFDRIHVGHRILLTESCLLANESVTVGVTQESMLGKKVLKELIRSVDERIGDVRQFVHDIKPSLHYKIVPIDDLYGPAGTDGSIECIVVSQETVRGANAINLRRVEQRMNELDVEVIQLVADEQHSPDEEDKVSSSSLRKRLLGTLIRPPLKKPSLPYIIGLTGGTASGKSSICTRLKGQGAGIIECDKLGHKSYEPGMPAYEKIIQHFGRNVLDANGLIDRKVLGSLVFNNKAELEKLNAIVWPAIRQLSLKEIETVSAEGYRVVVLDAAVLLEAGWDDMVHEIWTTVIPTDEAVKRLMDRNGLSADDAGKRIASQMLNEQRVSRANVVLCTLWHPDVTQKQVEKAWNLLQQRITVDTPGVQSM